VAAAAVDLALLFGLLARASSRRTGFLIGFAWGLGLFLTGVSWIYVSCRYMAACDGAVGAGHAFVLQRIGAVSCAGRALQARWSISPALKLLLGFPLLWGMSEWVRGWVLTGFPWLSLGIRKSPPAAGRLCAAAWVYGVSFVMALIAALLAWSVTPSASPPACVGAHCGAGAGCLWSDLARCRLDHARW